jgi:glycosyltransferase involved in cell wall biosynthesis
VEHATIWSRRQELAGAFSRASAVVAVSRRLRDFAVSVGTTPDAAHWIPNGVCEEVFHPGDRSRYRREWQISADDKLVVMAGNLVRLKGFHRGLEVVARLAAQGLPVRMRIAGPGGFDADYESELNRLVKSLGIQSNVQFCGPLDHPSLATLYNAADLFLLASEREGWPNVVHEAMACGTPVVATDVGAIPDLVRSSEHGIIVEPGNLNALVQATDIALARSWNRDAIAASAGSRSWSNVAAELVDLWEDLVRLHVSGTTPAAVRI